MRVLLATPLLLGALLPSLVSSQAPTFVPTAGSSTPDAGYNCPSSCQPPACKCASKDIPGSISVDKAPMFVTLTFDDAVQPATFDVINSIFNKTKNLNGCPLVGTFFVSTAYTDFWHVTGTYNLGNEIAVHTINHPDMANVTNPDAEIQGSLAAINAFGGVPKSKLTGFRFPFLSFKQSSFASVAKAGFQYESSVVLDPATQGYWPHTLDYGMPYSPQPCTSCPPGPQMVFKGLWEIPLYALLTNQSQVWSSMDPIINPQLNDYDVALNYLKFTFQLHYKTKLPFGIYQHLAQYIAWGPDVQQKKIALLTEFITWTQNSFKDVWYVTNQDLIRWIQNPVTADKMLEFLPCNMPATAKGNTEICDGIDNDGDGIVDNGVVESCQITPQANTMSCFGCPRAVPNITQPVPPLTGGSRKTVPDAGCPDLGTWDPVGGQCVKLTRPKAEPTNFGNSSTPGGGSGGGSGTSSADGIGGVVVAMGGAAVAGLMGLLMVM
ncbi:hypothetical protein HK104_001263 [Borealophlyctis nickersoniae]|nr:hypothetical protein HK104_001263 [Borealophlyctis nickersoniae]